MGVCKCVCVCVCDCRFLCLCTLCVSVCACLFCVCVCVCVCVCAYLTHVETWQWSITLNTPTWCCRLAAQLTDERVPLVSKFIKALDQFAQPFQMFKVM